MPLLKKSFKGSQSQTSNSKFKVPYLQQKHNIRDLIADNPIHKTRKQYNTFTETFSQKEFTNRSSSPETRAFSHEKENTYSQSTEIQKTTREKVTGKKGRKRKFSVNNEDSLSQDELNKPKIKSAYVEFMNKSLTKENGIEKNFVGHSSPMNYVEKSFSQNDFFKINLDSEDTALTTDNNNWLQNLTQEYSQTEISKVKVKSKGKNRRTDRKLCNNKLKSSEDNTTDDEIFELSQEILANHSVEVNSEEINSQSQTKPNHPTKKKKENKKQPRGKNRYEMSPSESKDSFSQEILNSGEVKAAYVEYMNNYLAKEKDTRKKRNFVLYSSSEDVFEEFEMLSQSNKSRADSEEIPPKKRKKDLSLKIRSRNDKSILSSKKNSKTNNKNKKKPQDHVKHPREENSDEEFAGLTLEEKMIEIYKKRNVGLYVLCDTCDKARFLPHTVDPLDLPNRWYCHMNPDKKHNKCSDPEEIEENKEFLIDNLYNAGSIVFVKMDGFPWWPAMVEDDPDTESYFWLEGESMKPTYYHTTFFDSAGVTRAWIRTRMIKPFKKNLMKRDFQISEKSNYRSRLTASYKQAEDASSIPLLDRLMKYGFVKRYKKRRNEKKLKIHNNKNKVMQLCEEDESGILSDINLSDLSFNFLD